MWAVGYVSRNAEMKALRKLREMQIEAFVPLGRRITKPQGKRRPVLTTFRIFPSYIFVNIPVGANFMKLRELKISFISVRDAEGNIQITPLSEKCVNDLMLRDEMSDLFPDYSKQDLRRTFYRNQLVCWKEQEDYALGFITKNTAGRPIAWVSTAGRPDIKIQVDKLSCL